MTRLHQRLCRLWLYLAVGLLFLSYPLVAIPFYFPPFMHQLALPSLFLLGLASIPVILSAYSWPRRWGLAVLAVYLVSLGVNAILRQELGMPAIELAAYALVPWAVAVIRRDTDSLTWRRVAWVLAVFWATQIVSGFVALAMDRDPIGFSGNRNWLAAALLATAPWPLLLCRGRLLKWAVAPVALSTLVLVWACASRGAWLGLVVAGLVAAWWHLRRLERALLIAFLVLLPITITVVAGNRVVRALQLDVRLPMIGRTVAMTVDHDYLGAAVVSLLTADRSHLREVQASLGVGPGRFREVFTPYRARSTYGERTHAAAVTIHPHNEFLNVAAQLGLAAGLAWLLMLLPALRRPGWSDRLTAWGALSAIVLFVHGMVDMVLVQPPTSLLALFFLGLCWGRWPAPAVGPRPESEFELYRSSAVYLAILVCLVAGGAATLREWRLGQAYRRALQAEYAAAYPDAIAAYEAQTRIDPANILAWYSAGRIALENLRQPRRALGYLDRARRLDPNYAHLNSLIGTALLVDGFPEDAHPFLLRETYLYPHEPEAWQKYVNVLVVTGRYRELPAVLRRLDEIYLQRAALAHGEAALRQLLAEWWDAARNGDEATAIARARTIGTPFRARFVDPLFVLITEGQQWPAPLLTDDFNVADYAYWRQLACFHAQGWTTIEDIAQAIAKRIRPDAAALAPSFRFLDQLLREGQGSPLERFAAFAFAARQLGSTAWLEPDGAAFVLTSDGRRLRVDLTAGAVTPLPEDAVPAPAARLCFYFQAYFVKNRELGVLARQYLPDARIAFDHLPVADLTAGLGELRIEAPSYRDLPSRCVREQIDLIYQRYQHEASTHP